MQTDLARGYRVDQATPISLLNYATPGTDRPLLGYRARAEDVPASAHPHPTAEIRLRLRDEGRDSFDRLARAKTEVSYPCHPV